MLPFAGGIEASANGVLVFSIVAAVLHLIRVDGAQSWARSGIKTAAVALLAVLAVYQDQPLLLVAALALSALGDYFISRDGEQAFMAGLVSFLVAQLAYVVLFGAAGEGPQLILAEWWRLALTAGLIAFVAVMLKLLLPAVGQHLRLPITVYVGAITLMGLAALTMHNRLVILGALSFIASDAILAIERFLLTAVSPHRAWTSYAIWTLYYVAQALILFGFIFAS